MIVVVFGLFLLAWSAQALHSPHEVIIDIAQYLMDGHGGGRHSARVFFGGDMSYAPYEVECPSSPPPSTEEWIWSADKLSKGERDFVHRRSEKVNHAVEKMMRRQGLPSPPRMPVIGYAISGGGYRSMLTGLGGLMGLMDHHEAHTAGTAGWFDAITYLTGLSGGAWGTGSFIANEGLSPMKLVEQIWNLESNLVYPDDDKLFFYSNIIGHLDGKRSTGHPVQLTDLWALAIAEHMLPPKWRFAGHPNMTVSALAKEIKGLETGDLPLPILVASQREEGEYVIAANATLWEFTPYSFGAWAFGSNEKVPGGFTPVEYLGSHLIDGKLSGKCWKGLDRLSFVMGTSSTLFNGALQLLNHTESKGIIVGLLKEILQELGQDDFDVSRIPNPFFNWTGQVNPLSNLTHLTLVDAGETNQNIPLEPLLTPERKVDAIIAYDASHDTPTGWPNGSSLHTTFTRAIILNEKDDTRIMMPDIPTGEEFVEGGLNRRPVFFGCDTTQTPMIIYIPQNPWTYYSNQSTFRLEYSLVEAQKMMLNGLRSTTLNSTTPIWSTCLSCALTDRAFGYTAENRTDICSECFKLFCWKRELHVVRSESLDEDGTYSPTMGIPSWLIENQIVKESSLKKMEERTASGWWEMAKREVDRVEQAVEVGLSQGPLKDWTSNMMKMVAKKLGYGV
nr:hypothetical protein L203_02050 [Cryptococcus depauperatus CBS 7841]